MQSPASPLTDKEAGSDPVSGPMFLRAVHEGDSMYRADEIENETLSGQIPPNTPPTRRWDLHILWTATLLFTLDVHRVARTCWMGGHRVSHRGRRKRSVSARQ